MTSPHERLPWHGLTDHVVFDGSVGFRNPLASRMDVRKRAFAQFTHDLASVIVEAAERQLAPLPKPNASRDAWGDVGVQDNALFPVEFADAINVPAHTKPDDIAFLQRKYWEDTCSDYASQFILTVLTKPANPFCHLAPLIYLAQHPRGAMRELLNVSSGDTQPGLRSFALFTMSYFLLLNLILALDSGTSFRRGTSRASLFHSRFQNSRPLFFSSSGNKDPHTAFWYSESRGYQSPDLQAAYSLSCFRLLVALYAIMNEATLRDIAVGVNPYKGTSSFDKAALVNVICRALKSIGPAFSDLEPLWVGDPPVTLAHSGWQSHFLGLPIEIHRYIYSFLPVGPQSLINLASTCKRLREICTPLIYVEPFPTVIEETLEAQSSALAMVLSSKPHLASHIRRLRVRVEGNLTASSAYKYPPLQLCLADSITHLVEVHLYVPYACSACDVKWEENNSLEVECHFRAMDAIAAVTRRWPNLSSLSLLQLGANLSHLDGAPTVPSPMPAELIPHHLEKLTIINAYRCPLPLVPWATQKALMNASSQTLRHLILCLDGSTTHDLPIFPNLERLKLSAWLPIKDIRPLLQESFSSVRFLSLDCGAPGQALDLSGIFHDLEHLHVETDFTSDYILPPSVVTFQMYSPDTNHPSISVNGSPLLAALCIDGNPSDRLVFMKNTFLDSSAFQTVRSLELRVFVDADELPQLGEIIAARLPKLEVLIPSVRDFREYRDRPRREDYPMDDGLDDMQKAAAVSLFKSCPGLNTISFNGIPDVWDPIGRFPARVWTRDSKEGGARMTGRAALPWKLGEIWDLQTPSILTVRMEIHVPPSVFPLDGRIKVLPDLI
ncbi:hypothetical protein BDZ89DRAFT_1147209 [Hymenopellis radicata]|nr:hypothetical protein BDZ89DRAFT_1147209 [Hymenopellis radicata]